METGQHVAVSVGMDEQEKQSRRNRESLAHFQFSEVSVALWRRTPSAIL